MCLILSTIPFAMGSTNSVYISALYVGSSGEKPNQEYVQITDGGREPVNLNGWKIKDEGEKHIYTFSSYTLNSKSTVTLRSGRGKNSGNTLYWNKYSFIWNNHDERFNEDGDTAYLYNAQGELVSSMKG